VKDRPQAAQILAGSWDFFTPVGMATHDDPMTYKIEHTGIALMEYEEC
jgi:hypothetical protein